MNARRAILVAALVLTAAFLALFIFLSSLSAQPGGRPGAGRGSGALSWSETQADPLLTMTYPEFLAKSSQPPAPIPQGLLVDDKGQPAKRTAAGWSQLQELYSKAKAAEEIQAAPTPGRVGKQLWTQAQTQLAVIKKENIAMLKAATAADDAFTFTVGRPQYDPRDVTGSSVTVRVGVVMHVKPQASKNYGATIYRLLKPYDNYGEDREPFTFVTYQGGYFRPQTFMLHPTSVALWDMLWTTPVVGLALKDTHGNVIAASQTSAGLNSNAPTLIAYPPEIRRTPAFAYLMPEADRTFTGQRWNLDYTHGWYYEFTFQIAMEDLVRVDKAVAGLIILPKQMVPDLVDEVSKAQTPEEIAGIVQPIVQGYISGQAGAFGQPQGAVTAARPGAYAPRAAGAPGAPAGRPGAGSAAVPAPPPPPLPMGPPQGVGPPI